MPDRALEWRYWVMEYSTADRAQSILLHRAAHWVFEISRYDTEDTYLEFSRGERPRRIHQVRQSPRHESPGRARIRRDRAAFTRARLLGHLYPIQHRRAQCLGCRLSEPASAAWMFAQRRGQFAAS